MLTAGLSVQVDLHFIFHHDNTLWNLVGKIYFFKLSKRSLPVFEPEPNNSNDWLIKSFSRFVILLTWNFAFIDFHLQADCAYLTVILLSVQRLHHYQDPQDI